MKEVAAEELIYGYVHGVFPMAEKDGTIYWYSPDPRAIIPIDSYKVSRSLKPVLNQRQFQIKVDHDFEAVIRNCAGPRHNENDTWISEGLIEAYTSLHEMGFAHSVETYQDDQLVGGLYGVSIGAAFFGESMFHRVSNASKVAFHYLMQILKREKYRLLDTQFMNDNVERFGAIEVSRSQYLGLLRNATGKRSRFRL